MGCHSSLGDSQEKLAIDRVTGNKQITESLPKFPTRRSLFTPLVLQFVHALKVEGGRWAIRKVDAGKLMQELLQIPACVVMVTGIR